MAKENTFDIVSRVDMQEVRNSVDQAVREIRTRFDFKGSRSDIIFNGEEITLIGDDDFKLRNVIDILENRLVKRGINIKALRTEKLSLRRRTLFARSSTWCRVWTRSSQR